MGLSPPKKHLSLCGMNMGPSNLKEVIDKNKKVFCNLRQLDLSCNKVGAEGIRHLSGISFNLTQIYLCQNNIGPEGAKILGRGNFKFIIKLWLNENKIGDEGVKHIANGSFSHLEKMSLQLNNVNAKGVKHLANGDFMNLTFLCLKKNNVGNEGVRYLANSNFPNLTDLMLSMVFYLLSKQQNWNGRSQTILAQDFQELKVLSLSSNRIDTEGAKCLIDGNLKNLKKLSLSLNKIKQQNKQKLKKIIEQISQTQIQL